MAGGGIDVEGLHELNLALSKIDPKLRSNLRKRLAKIAVAVRTDVRAAMPSRSGRARMSVRSGAGVNGAFVAMGKKETPYTPFLDFGGTLRPSGGRKGTQVRPIVKGGRYLYPTIARHREQTQAEAVAAIEETKRELGLR